MILIYVCFPVVGVGTETSFFCLNVQNQQKRTFSLVESICNSGIFKYYGIYTYCTQRKWGDHLRLLDSYYFALFLCSIQKIFSGDMGNENFSAIVSTLYLYYNCHLPRLSYIQTSMRLEKFKYPWKKQLLNSRISEKRCNLEWCSRGYVLISQM
jgi:hypothetical protein